jgi:hypothetical protein
MKQFKWLLLALIAGMLVTAGCHHTDSHSDRGHYEDDRYRRY